MPSILLGTLFTNNDTAELLDMQDKVRLFWEYHPDVQEWCRLNIADMCDDRVAVIPSVWGRFHTEYLFELQDVSPDEALSARLRFS